MGHGKLGDVMADISMEGLTSDCAKLSFEGVQSRNHRLCREMVAGP
jgi:hypothetical protein